VGVFTRPRVDITVNADSIDVQGLRSRSGLAPVFHVIRQAATRPWVIVGGPGLDLVQPAQFALHLFRRHEWPSDAPCGVTSSCSCSPCCCLVQACFPGCDTTFTSTYARLSRNTTAVNSRPGAAMDSLTAEPGRSTFSGDSRCYKAGARSFIRGNSTRDLTNVAAAKHYWIARCARIVRCACS